MAVSTDYGGLHSGSSVAAQSIACSKRLDSGQRCEVKKAMKSRGGLGREVREPSPTSPPPSIFMFSHSFLLCNAPHQLNAWNRLHSPMREKHSLGFLSVSCAVSHLLVYKIKCCDCRGPFMLVRPPKT